MAAGQDPPTTGATAPAPEQTMEEFIEERNRPQAPPTPEPPTEGPPTPEPPAQPVPPEPTEATGPGHLTAEQRIQQLVAKQREAERRETAKAQEAEYWRAVAEGRIKPSVPGVPPQPVPPQPEAAPGELKLPHIEDFENSRDFEEAHAKYIVEKAKSDLRKELEEERAQQSWNDLERKHQERMAAAVVTDPTLAEAAADPTLPVSSAMAVAIKESDDGPAIVRYLANHRDEAARIARLHPVRAAREIGRIEGMIGSAKTTPEPPQPRTVSQAPAPTRPVGGTKGSVEVDEDSLSIEEVIRRRNEAQYGKRR